ncbi:MAG: PqqD family protein [Desulfotalea sp.]|nr:MAG: PqqD family protein [Desulfotalea sp.]
MKLSRLFKKKPAAPQAKTTITRTESLACIPEKICTISWHKQENGEVIIEYPLPLKPFFISIARRFYKTEEPTLTKKLQLDSVGTKVWLLVDGSTDVKTIIKEIAPWTGLSLQEAELSVTTFLRELGRRGLIIIK